MADEKLIGVKLKLCFKNQIGLFSPLPDAESSLQIAPADTQEHRLPDKKN